MRRHTSFEQLLARREELTGAERAELERHLAVCPACREAAADYELQDVALRAFARQQPRAILYGPVLSRVDALEVRRESPVPAFLGAFAGAFTAVIVLLGAILWSRGVLPGVLPHGAAHTAAVTKLSQCKVRGDGWSATGYCQVISSPSQFHGPGVVFYQGSLSWVRKHLQKPVFIVKQGKGLPPITYDPHASNVSFGEVAFDPQRQTALYAVGKETP